MKKPQRRVWVGLLLVAVIVAATAYVAGTSSSTRKSGFCAMLPDSIGLYAGNQVTQMGYQIGSIESIVPEEDGVKVQFSVDAGREIPANVKAVTRSKSVLADRSLELVGDVESSGPRLQSGNCISVENSYTPKSISQITGSAADLMEQIAPKGDTRALEGAIEGTSVAMDGTGPDIANLLQTASQAADSPERIVSDIGSIIANMAPLSSNALERWPDIESIITKLPEATDVAARVLWPGVDRLAIGLNPVIRAVSDFVPRYSQYLYPALNDLADGIHIAATRVGEIEQGLNVLPSLASEASLVSSKQEGAGVRVASPEVRVRTTDSGKLCAVLNKSRLGSCRPDGSDARLVRVGALDILVAGGVR